jgi:hypothetical protein
MAGAVLLILVTENRFQRLKIGVNVREEGYAHRNASRRYEAIRFLLRPA